MLNDNARIIYYLAQCGRLTSRQRRRIRKEAREARKRSALLPTP